jgi:hypothetical protein
MATLHFYLNTVEEGGETTFFDRHNRIKEEYIVNSNKADGEFRF